MYHLKLLGALAVFVLSDYVTTPVSSVHKPEIHILICRFACQLPWLRLDALMVVYVCVSAAIDLNILRYQQLNLVWTLPRFSQIATKDVHWAWILAAVFLPISLVRLALLFPSMDLRSGPFCLEGMGSWRRLFGGLHSGVPVRRGVW